MLNFFKICRLVELFKQKKDVKMPVITGFLSTHFLNILLDELAAHEPQVQAALMGIASNLFDELKVKLDAEMAKLKTGV